MSEKATEQIRASRDVASRRALSAIEALRTSLDATEREIRRSIEGEPARSDYFVPNGQYLREVVEYGSAYAALWFATGLAEGEAAR